MTRLKAKQIADRCAELWHDIDPWSDEPELTEDYIRFTVDDIMSGGTETIEQIQEAIEDYPDNDEVVAEARELINTIMEGTGNDN